MNVSQPCPTCKREKIVYIDPKNDQVMCSECRTLLPATHFLKVQLKSLRQFPPKETIAFGVTCKPCQRQVSPTPKAGTEDYLCPHCKEVLPLSNIFKQILKNKKPSEL